MTQPQYSVAEFAARIKEKYPAYADVDDQELVSRILEKYPQYGEQIKKKDDTESVLDDGSLASPEIAVAESVRTPVVPEPVEVLDETPARTLEPVAEEAAPADVPVGQSVAVDVPAAPEPVLDFVTGDEEFDKSLGFVNADLVDRGDERQVARELTAEFKDFGFDFESTGIGDAIKVTARNGETMEVDLDPAWYNFGVDEGEEAKSLRKFLTDNKDTSELIDAEAALQDADLMMNEYRTEEEDIVKEFDDVIAQLGEYSEDDVRANPSGYQKLVEKHNDIVGRYQRWSIESADARVMYNEALANVERLSKPREKLTALERTFGRNSLTNWVSDFTTRAIDQGLAQGATIRENLNLAINANDVTDEELDDFRRAVLAAAEAGPSDEMQEFNRRVEKKTKGMSYGGKLLTTLFEVAKNPSILPELTVSSVAMMANKEVVLGGVPLGLGGLALGPGGALTGFAAGAATTLEAGLSFGEFMMEELAAKQGVDINEVDMSNESLREVLSDTEAMSRMRNRAAGRGVAMGLFNAATKNVASGVTRRVVGKTGSKMKGVLAAGAVDMPLESAGEAVGRIAGRQEMDPMEIVLEGAAKGPGFVVGVAEGLVRSPKYTLNGERVGGKTMAKFINEASEAEVAGATIEIKNDKVLAGIANDKRNAARERQIIGKQLRESGITDEAKVQTLTDLEMEKRKLAGNETTSGKRKRERIQREIDATLEGDSYFFEETTDEQGNTVSNEVRVTRAEAIQALKDDDITRPTEKEIEQKQAELFRDAMAAIGKEDAVQEPSTEEVDVGEQPADGEEVGVGDAEEEVVAEAEEAEAQELAERLEAEGTPDVTEQLGDNITAERRQGTTLGKKQEKVVAQAKKRAAALANSIPGLQVKLYETTAQYQRATGFDGKGSYTYDNDVDADGKVVGKKNRVIHINLETANTRTVAHEAFHAMFLENLSDQEYQKQAKALMSTVRKALADDSDMARRIDEFVAAYDEAEIDEEALSEIFGYISNGYGQLSAPEQSRIKAAIKALIERVTGIKLESGWSEGDQNVLDVLNTLAQKLEAGEEVTAEEIGALRVDEERVAEVEAAVDIDSRIAAAQEKVRGIGEAALEALGELANLATEVDEEAGLNLFRSVSKAISEKKASATIKKMRDVKKSKRMSADDKAERLTKLEAQLEGELERLNAEREKAAPKIAEAVERLKAKAETKRAQAAKEKRLAEIKEEGKAITKERAKAIKDAKKEFEGEELKTALEVIEEETKAKRDKLKAEKAELEKKPVKEAPVEEAPVEEAPVVEETPTVGTIRTKVGVEAFGKLEAAVRDYLEYMDALDPEEDMTRGQKSASTRRVNKVVKLATELGLTDAEQAVMQNSVLEKIEAEKRTAEAKETEAAERKAAAERAKKAAEEKVVEEEPTPEPTVDDVAKRAAVEGVSVEELTKEQQKVERQRKDTLSREAKRELDGLKGKTDKASKAKRAELKEFMSNLGTMSVDEAQAKRTEGKLKAREQKASEFSEKRINELGRQGILSHFTQVNFKKFDPSLEKRGFYGGGVYFTTGKQWGTGWTEDDFGTQVAFVDTNKMKILTGSEALNRLVTPEEYNQALAVIKSLTVPGENFTFGSRFSDEQIKYRFLGDGKLVDGELIDYQDNRLSLGYMDMYMRSGMLRANFFTRGIQDVVTKQEAREAGAGYLVTPVFKAVYPEYQGKINTTGVDVDSIVEPGLQDGVIWDYDAINENILTDVSPEEGVLVRPISDAEHIRYTYYGEAPKAREQKASEVLGRYKFRPDGSLIGDSRLASELRGYMRKFGFGVEQFGDRVDRFHIVDERGRKVKPADVIAKDRAEEADEIATRKEAMAVTEEVDDARSEELKRYQAEYLDFPEEMIPPSTKNFRQQKGQLGAATEGLSTAAVVQFAKERGFSDKAILAIRPGAQQAIDKYDERAARVNREVQGIIQRTRERARGDKDIQAIENKARRTRAVNDRIEEDVLAYLKGTKFYKDASDVGREAMVRAVRKQMGRRMKSAPSVIKLGIDNGIPTIDKRDLNRQIRMIAESSRQTALAMREAMRAIGKDIELMQSKGLITGRQATLILKKLAATDPLNPVQVEKFTDYAARVFANAEYEQEVKRLNARRKRAFKQFETKLGVHKDYAPMLRTLLLIDATMIPQEVLEEYGMLIDMLGERKAVLDLDQSVIVGDLTTKVMTAVDEELSLKEELLARYENYPDKKKGYSSTIDAMVKDGELSQEEADVLRKYVSELVEEEEKSEGQREQEAEEKARRDDKEMARLRQALRVLRRPDVDFGMREERELVKKFYRMVKTEAVEGLTLPELKNALRVADNIENGFLPHMAQVLVEKMDAHQKARQVERAIKEARIPKRKLAYSKVAGVFGGPNATLELIKRNPLRYIDQVLGDFKSTRVYDAVFKPLAKAYAQYNSEMISIQERLDKVEARLVSKYKRNPNAITRSKFLIGAYMMQREFENNVGVDGVFSAEDLLLSTIDADGVGEAYYTGKTTEMLQGILEEIKGKTADEIEASLNEDEKAVAEEIRAINDELTPKAQYVAGVIRGVPFRPFSQYFHRISLKDDQPAGLDGVKGLIEQVNKNMRPSTRAKNLEVRTGSIGPVNFDPFASANRGAKFVLTDYYMTEPVRTAGRMANDLKGVKELTAAQKSLRDALTGKRGAINTAIADVLVQSYTINTQFDKLLEFVKKQAYRMALADGPRFIAELLSNLAFVGFANPGGFAEGVRMMRDIKTMREHSGVDILRNVGSVQTTRLFPKPDTISSRVVDSLRTSLGPDQSRVGGAVENNLKQIWAQTAQRLQDAKVTSQLADWMITTPDKMVTQPVWFGVFSNTFKEQTGQEVDFTKLAENDEAYMNQYEDAIKASTDAADDASVRTGATDNAFLGILRGTIRPDDSSVQSWFAMANSYMTRFLIFEYATARTAIQAAIGNGTISRGEGRRLIIATSARMVLYSFIVDILRRELDKALGFTDDDDEKEAGELMGDALLTGATSLVFGRTSGQIGRGLKGMLVENLNENYLHPDDYDYDERIMMPLIDLKSAERRPYKAINDVVTASLGPYGAPARTGVLAIKKATEKDRVKGSAIDRQEAEFNRLYLELAGMFGFVPLYKDLRRLYIKEIYKDLD